MDFRTVKEIEIPEGKVITINIGSTVIWNRPNSVNYFYLEAIDNTNVTISRVGNPSVSPVLEYSTNGSTWQRYTIGTQISLTSGQRVYFKGNNTQMCSGQNDGHKVTSTGRINAGGNIMTLLDETGTQDTISVAECFNSFFANCTTLIMPPEIPVVSIAGANGSLSRMFQGCTNLETLPKIYITGQIPNYGLQYMFSGCTKIQLMTTDQGGFEEYRVPVSGTMTTSGTQQPITGFANGTGGNVTSNFQANTVYYLGYQGAFPITFDTIENMENNTYKMVLLANPYKESGYFMGYNNGTIKSDGFQTYKEYNIEGKNLSNNTSYIMYLVKCNNAYYLETQKPTEGQPTFNKTTSMPSDKAMVLLKCKSNNYFIGLNNSSTTATNTENTAKANTNYYFTLEKSSSTSSGQFYIKNYNGKYLSTSGSGSSTKIVWGTTKKVFYLTYSNSGFTIGTKSSGSYIEFLVSGSNYSFDDHGQTKHYWEIYVGTSQLSPDGVSPNNSNGNVSWTDPQALTIESQSSISSIDGLCDNADKSKLVSIKQNSKYLTKGNSTPTYTDVISSETLWYLYEPYGLTTTE